MSSAKHTPGPWRVTANAGGWSASHDGVGCSAYQGIRAGDEVVALSVAQGNDPWRDAPDTSANARLIAAAPDLLEACANALDILQADRQSLVDCHTLRDTRTDDPIAHGLVWVSDGVWIEPTIADALRDYDRAIAQSISAISKATGAAA